MSFIDELNAIGITPNQPAQPAPGGGNFQQELDRLGIKPTAQPQPSTDDWQRVLYS